tara:strand:- start:732 stop:932 length:201 start_codon:yes stop_codon:yes gene_type:complete
MKVGDLVKYRAYAKINIGLVVEIANEEIYGPGNRVVFRGMRRVKWFAVAHPYWVSQKNLEVVSEGR